MQRLCLKVGCVCEDEVYDPIRVLTRMILGAQSILRAFTRDDFPEDPEQIFLTSWGEWWGKDVYENSLDKALQDKWCPGLEEIEREEGITA